MDYDTGRANAVAEQLLRHLCPTSYVDAVLPAHPYVIAVTTAMGMEVGHEDVEAKVTLVHASNEKIFGSGVLVSVNDNRRLAAG